MLINVHVKLVKSELIDETLFQNILYIFFYKLKGNVLHKIDVPDLFNYR